MQFTKNNIKGFTLIELLVVITIIGILAVGGTTVYTSQIQKARDTTRLSDVKALQGAVEQVFSDMASYPDVGTAAALPDTTNCQSATAGSSNLDCIVRLGFMTNLPKDPKNSQSGNGSPLDYTYTTGPIGSVAQQAYEVSTGLENSGNISSKAGADGGNDGNRYEIGNLLSLQTGVTNVTTQAVGNSTAFAVGAKNSCTSFGAQAQSTAAAQGTVVLIRGNCQ